MSERWTGPLFVDIEDNGAHAVEIDDGHGHRITLGVWVKQSDGSRVLRLPVCGCEAHDRIVALLLREQ